MTGFKPSVPVLLSDGGERHIRFTMGTMRRLRERCGLTFADLRDRDKMAALMGDQLALVIWAALVDDDEREELSIEQIEELIDWRDLQRITGSLAIAMGNEDAEAGPTIAPVQTADPSNSNSAGPSQELSSVLVTANFGP